MKQLGVEISVACLAIALTCAPAFPNAKGTQHPSPARRRIGIELCQEAGTFEQRQYGLEQPDQRQQQLEQPNSQMLDSDGDDSRQYNLEQPDQQQQDLERPRYEYN